MFDEVNPNGILPRLCWTILRAKLYNCNRDQARSVDVDTIKNAENAAAIVDAVYSRDSLLIVLNVYSDFFALMDTKRGFNEYFKMFEARFDALVSKFRCHGDKIDFSKPLIALHLMNATNVDDVQYIFTLAVCVSKTSVPDSTASKTKNAVFFKI